MAKDLNNPTAPTKPTTVDYAHPPEHPEHHEHSDVNIRALWMFVGIFVVSTVVILLVLWATFGYFDRAFTAEDPAPSGVKSTDRTPPADIPRLQGIPGYNTRTPRQDREAMDAENKRRISSYGRNADGTIHVPVARAMQIVVEQNLLGANRPATTTTTAPTTQPHKGGAGAAR